MPGTDPALLAGFLRRSTWMYSLDLLAPSTMSLLPHPEVIHSGDGGQPTAWEAGEL